MYLKNFVLSIFVTTLATSSGAASIDQASIQISLDSETNLDAVGADSAPVSDQGIGLNGETTAASVLSNRYRYPGGSWVDTCPDQTVNYDSNGNPAQIIAYCYDHSHKLVRNGVWVWSCETGCFYNDDGHLKCGSC